MPVMNTIRGLFVKLLQGDSSEMWNVETRNLGVRLKRPQSRMKTCTLSVQMITSFTLLSSVTF